MKIIILFMCVFSFGCVTSRHQKSSSLKSQPATRSTSKQVASLALGKKTLAPKSPMTEAEQDRKDRDLLLKRKAEIERLQPQKAAQNVRTPILGSGAIEGLSEMQLYSQLLACYERNDELGFKRHLDSFMKRFPQSTRADEALYMAGLSSMGSKNYGLALKYFNQVIQQYPYGSKAPMALFAKASVLKKLDFAPASKGVFEQVMARYPGSPEAERAKQELRLVR